MYRTQLWLHGTNPSVDLKRKQDHFNEPACFKLKRKRGRQTTLRSCTVLGFGSLESHLPQLNGRILGTCHPRSTNLMTWKMCLWLPLGLTLGCIQVCSTRMMPSTSFAQFDEARSIKTPPEPPQGGNLLGDTTFFWSFFPVCDIEGSLIPYKGPVASPPLGATASATLL